MKKIAGNVMWGLAAVLLGWIPVSPTFAYQFRANGPSVVLADHGRLHFRADDDMRLREERPNFLPRHNITQENIERENRYGPGREGLGREGLGREGLGREGLGRDALGHDRARQAMQNGEILPLSAIRHQVHQRFGGKIVGVELQEGNERRGASPPWVYDLRVLSPEGHVLSVEMDASDGHIIGVRGQR